LLATPTAWLGRRASHAIGNPDRWHNPERSNELSDQIATLKLLPTPAATEYGNNQSPSDGAAVRPSLPNLVKLLPTPVRQDGKNATAPSQEDRHSPGLPTTVRLLPTPTAHERTHTPRPVDHGAQFANEVFALIGASTSPPSDAGNGSQALLLNPCFVEWMQGLPADWSDPDCPLSATEFKSSAATSPERTPGTCSEATNNGA